MNDSPSSPTADPHVWAVIMAGGSGTRFWPVSRKAFPKQLNRLISDETMIQATVARLQPLIDPTRVLVITREDLAAETRRQLPALPAHQIIGEPMGRDTAPCVALAAEIVQAQDPEGVLVVLPADQVIQPVDRLQECLSRGIAAAREGGLVTYGIEPRFPATGYGYIKQGEAIDEGDIGVHKVARFVEKPDEATAKGYLSEGGYLWNSGMFTWRADVVLDKLREHCADILAKLDPLMSDWGTAAFADRLADVYPTLTKISVDYALMEKADDVKVVTADFRWDDVGSWDAVYDHLPVGDDGITRVGESIAIDCNDCLLFNNTDGKTLITAVGLEGVSVVATGDAILVCKKGESQKVKELVAALEKAGHQGLL